MLPRILDALGKVSVHVHVAVTLSNTLQMETLIKRSAKHTDALKKQVAAFKTTAAYEPYTPNTARW